MDSNESQMTVEYSPSYWSKRYPQAEVVDNHIRTVTRASEKVKENIPYITVAYGKKNSSQLDIFGLSLPEDSPILVYIHGGYWQSLSRGESCYPAGPLVAAGVRVLVPDYCLAPQASIAEIVEEIKQLAEYVLQLAAKNLIRSVWFGGHSAGAHLAASLLDETWISSLHPSLLNSFSGILLISGIYDLQPIIHTTINDPLKLNKEDAYDLSPINKNLTWFHKMGLNLQIIIAVAENDSPSFKNQSSKYNVFLERNDIKTTFLCLPELDHFSIVENLENEDYSLTKLIINSIYSNL